MTTRAYIFAGGGTGGHLYPGLAIARKLIDRAREMDGVAETLFVCSQRPLDSEILDKEGVAYRTISAVPLSVRPKGLVRFGVTWARAVGESRAIIQGLAHEIGSPPVVVAMGGFVAAPVVRAAQKERCRVVLVNLDAEPGKANRLIARVAATNSHGVGGGIYSAAIVEPRARGKSRHWQTIGPIVRDSALAPSSQADCRAKLGLDPALPVLMVTGGSQGAQSINDFVLRFFETADTRTPPIDVRAWQVLHQTGKGSATAIAQRYAAMGVRAIVQEFVDGAPGTGTMGEWWGAAEAAVARAGAGSVAEAWANRVPTLFMPYPYHKDEHQRKNAAGLASAGAAALVRDEIDVEKNVQSTGGGGGGALASLLGDPARREAMKKALSALGPADGAERVAKALWALPPA